MKYIFILSSILFLFASIANGANTTDISEMEAETIELPEIPSILRTPAQRADYLIAHYWDKLDLTDTVVCHNQVLMEQSFVNFLSILPYASSDSIVKDGFLLFLDKITADPYLYRTMKSIAEDYLYNPDSPMLSEEFYLLYLLALRDSNALSQTDIIRLDDRIDMIGKNRKGTKAADFSFVTPDGMESSLYSTLTDGKDLMLIFFDPECENCERVMKQIQNDPKINNDIESGKLQILAVYSGENETSWKKKAVTLPKSWTIGINISEIEDKDLYFFPDMPTIYVLNNQGIVLEKNLQLR